MKVLIMVFSLLWMAAGVALILYTGKVRSYLAGRFEKANIRLMAAAPLALGLLFLAASFAQGEIVPLFLILGSLAVAKGIYFLFGPITQIRNVIQWWCEQADEITLRAWGIATLVLGIAVFSCIVRI